MSVPDRFQSTTDLGHFASAKVLGQFAEGLLDLPKRDLALFVSDLDLVDRDVGNPPGGLLALTGEHVTNPGRRTFGHQDHPGLADHSGDHVLVAIDGDRGCDGPLPAQGFDDRGRCSGLALDARVSGAHRATTEPERPGDQTHRNGDEHGRQPVDENRDRDRNHDDRGEHDAEDLGPQELVDLLGHRPVLADRCEAGFDLAHGQGA